jgi:hypothetical protein
MLVAAPLHAATPTPSTPNDCVGAGGQGDPCGVDADCAGKAYATRCAHFGAPIDADQCAIPCEAIEDEGGLLQVTRAPSLCAVGEICAATWFDTEARVGHVCLPVPFHMDLALLDQCVVHFIQGSQPAFSDGDCSLQANLDRLLDQDSDGEFDIFDVDLCVLAFLEQPHCLADANGDWPEGCCDPEVKSSCMPGDVPRCADHADCGQGLYCDLDRAVCQRECGIVASREESLSSLERQCPGALKVCDRTRGRCVVVDVTQQSCEIDQDCPAGAYCFLGRCAPRCYSSLECPDAGWICSQNNRCRALPPPAGPEGFVFDPANYAVRFARDSLELSVTDPDDESALVIMDLITKRQVLDNPAVSFGYRMEVHYGLKTDQRCTQAFVDCTDPAQLPIKPDTGVKETEEECQARQDDCLIDPSEQWIRLPSPFGTVNASGDSAVVVELDAFIAEDLSPGTWPATVKLFFDNGDYDTIPVSFSKTSPSGTYEGDLTVYRDDPANALNAYRPLTFNMDIWVDESQETTWDALMATHHLDMDDEGIIDVTSGYPVVARLDGTSALAFSRGGAASTSADSVPFVGLYSPDSSALRLVGVIEISADFCIDEQGEDCSTAADAASSEDEILRVDNVFNRTIRRRIQFMGPFETSIGRYHGMYRETIYGLLPGGGVTLSGGFIMDQTSGDASPIELAGPLLEPATGAEAGVTYESALIGEAITFPETQALTETTARLTACATSLDSDATGSAGATPSVAWPADLFSTCGETCAELDPLAASAEGAWAAPAAFNDCCRFRRYLHLAQRGDNTVFGDLLDFRDVIEVSLANLGQSDAEQNYLNVYDYLSNWVVPCDADDPQPPPVCIDEERLRCGLALHQMAILNDWVDVDALGAGGGAGVDSSDGQDLFCLATMPTSGCPQAAAGHEDLFALQEHNRFWRDLALALKFEADRARSDAFLVLYRNEMNPFAQGTALSYKADHLREAVQRYDEVVRLVAGAPAAEILFSWPAGEFKQAGNDWLVIMQTVVEDRLGAIQELVDLKRRVFIDADDKDLVFAHHLMQQEYLLQVYLMLLQETWQGADFAYRGAAGAHLEQGQEIVTQLNPAWNPIGAHGSRVFFENPAADKTNWEAYRDRLIGATGDGGAVAEARTQVTDAVTDMQAALRDVDALEASLQEAKWGLEDSLASLCGDPNPTATGCAAGLSYCQCLVKEYLAADKWDEVQACKLSGGATCPPGVQLQCGEVGGGMGLSHGGAQDLAALGSQTCTQVIMTSFGQGSSDTATAPACAIDPTLVTVTGADGKGRACVGGKMGAALQEQAAMDLQRETVLDSLNGVFLDMKAYVKLRAQLLEDLQEFHAERERLLLIKAILEGLPPLLEFAKQKVLSFAGVPDCVQIYGMAMGTDCLGKLLTTATQKGINILFEVLIVAAEAAASKMDTEIRLAINQLAEQEISHETRAALERYQVQIHDLLIEYRLLTQASFNLYLKQADLRWQAQHALDRFGEEATFVAEHLVGRETGSLLRGEGVAREASEGFRDLVMLSYKMTMAFIHQYNVPTTQAASLINASLASVTLDDVADYAETLTTLEDDYCGFEAIDCDASTNVETLRYSLRSLLFPNLMDIVDAQTGAVVTAGQQFHNLITSPPYLKRRVRGVLPADQIELPVPVSLMLMENLPGGPKWVIDPLTCNHLLTARDPDTPANPGYGDGNVAVNVRGLNLGQGDQVVRYELIRGPTDYLRSCSAESVQQEIGTLPIMEYPIRTYAVGYAPHSPEAAAEAPPIYATRSAAFPACMNLDEQGGVVEDATCWRYFARDRSLSSMDWKLVVPLYVGDGATDNAWIAGEGLSEAERPIIEDLVLYFRYRTRPIQE